MTGAATLAGRRSRPEPLARQSPLCDALELALDEGPGALEALRGGRPVDRRDRVTSLLALYALHTAPVAALGDRARLQGHPVVAELKDRLETAWIAELDRVEVPEGDTLAEMRSLATRDRIPDCYRWLAEAATWDELVHFLALEGGPDAGFDDLVAACQLGLHGSAKLELAANYWDEMGNGRLDHVHTILHEQMVAAIDMPRIAPADQPTEALERAAAGALLATNRYLQPELLGALGLTELQAGPRCRMVVRAFDRLGAPAEAYPFYAVHAQVDPLHGRAWLENAIAPTVDELPAWGPRILRGAAWRAQLNTAFFDVAWPIVQQREGRAVAT